MTIKAHCLKPGDRIVLPEIVCEHVIVIGPVWEPAEVWLEDEVGHVHTLPGDATVEMLERRAS